MKKYCCVYSAHGSSSSWGFANDKIVKVFDNQKDRDTFVKNSSNISMKIIPVKEATKHAANYSLTQNKTIRPKPFTSEYWGIVSDDYFDKDNQIPGCIGTLQVCDDYNDYIKGIPFYN